MGGKSAISSRVDHRTLTKEDPGDIFDPPLWEMRDALAKLIGLPDDYYEYATWEIMLGTY